MNELDLVVCNHHIHRVLDISNDKILVIDCESLTMPKWISKALELEEIVSGDNEYNTPQYDSLSQAQKSLAHKRYTMIAPILPFVSDDYMRTHLIAKIADKENITKQTVRKYLCLYLAYQDIGRLVPLKNISKRPLSNDEKNFRWALNRYYYSPLKHTLIGSYTLMLKECYTTPNGQLREGYPPFHRYRYFFNKTKKLQSLYISRDGLSDYQRNHRPLLGDGVQEFAPSIGTGMLDSTILDIYLVNDAGQLVGRPILTTCIDAYTSLCCGYALTWEGGVYSLKSLMENIICDKVEHCKSLGICIEKDEWNCDKLPAILVTDKGREYTSCNFEQLADLGVSIINLPPFRPDLKSKVEQFFNVIQNLFKPHLKAYGVVEPNYQERGVQDYRQNACLTLNELETILVKCILYYNTKRVLDAKQYSQELFSDGVKPFSNEIWNHSLKHPGANLIEVSKEQLTLTMFPRGNGTFTRRGLVFKNLRYVANGFTERFLVGGECVVAYDPNQTSHIWLYENGEYTKFALIDKRFDNISFQEAKEQVHEEKAFTKTFEEECMQARIALVKDIETIANVHPKKQGVDASDVRATRRKERIKKRIEG